MKPTSAVRCRSRLGWSVLAVLLLAAGCGGAASRVTYDDTTGSSTQPNTAAGDTATSGAVSPGTASPPAGGGRFVTLPVGSPLPSDATCASRVRRDGPEVRPANAVYNQTRGHPTSASADPGHPRFARVTGDFVGTTDEIIQWAACKWGIDEDVVRAQAAKETYWFQRNGGDFTTDPANCVPGHPIGADGKPGQCPESIGIMQTRYPYMTATIVDSAASTAYNLDVAYAVWRTCYEGEEEWLGTVDRGQPYTAGDLWGCVGRWFAGRWYTQPAKEYIAAVQDYVNQRIWETEGFLDSHG